MTSARCDAKGSVEVVLSHALPIHAEIRARSGAIGEIALHFLENNLVTNYQLQTGLRSKGEVGSYNSSLSVITTSHPNYESS